MKQILRALPLVSLLALAGCGGSSVQVSNIGPTLAQPNPSLQTASVGPAPSQQIATAQSMTDVTAFVDASVLPRLSERERTEASSAQFNALQFGRAGAPRSWQGDRGASGQVVVGPPVNVNALYCREFTHTVTVGGTPFAKKGMACREADGRWGVVSTG
jgi:surface antigen